ncbi:MAG: hypothetical protein K5829_15980 [Treponema sp.]|nr:hypothetical protein [Treponema sp.]
MKKARLLLYLSFISLIVAGCSKFSDFAVPKSFGLKTTAAEYNVSVLNTEADLSEKLNISSMISGMSSGEGSDESSTEMQSYIYNPDNEAEIYELAMAMSLEEIPIDFSSYFENVDFTSGLNSMSIDKTIEIPNVDLSEEKVLELDQVNEAINNLIVTYNVTDGNEKFINLDVFLAAGSSFEKLSYSSGYLVVSGVTESEAQTVYENFGYLCPTGELSGSVTLKHIDEDTEESTEIGSADFEDGVAKINLTDVDFYSSGMSLVFEGASIGQGYKVYVDPTSQLKKAEDVSIAAPFTFSVDDVTLSLGNDSALKSCTVEEGSMNVQIDIPNSWENFDLEYEIELTGGINATFTSNETSHDLANESFTNEDVSASSDIEDVQLSNSTIDFENPPILSIDLNLEKIKSAAIEFSNDFATSVNHTQELPKEVLKYIKGITWNPSGIEIVCTNTLPAGNDITVNVESDFLDLSNSTVLETAGEADPLSIKCAQNLFTAIGSGENEFSSIDFSASLAFENLTGGEGETKILTINNIEFNDEVDEEGNPLPTTYQISLVINPVFDWENIKINADSEGINQSDTVNTGMNLSSILSGNEMMADFAGSIELTKVPMYLYCDLPSVLGDSTGFSGTIKGFLADGDDDTLTPLENTEVYFLATENEDGTYSDAVLESASCPNLETNADGELITNLKNSPASSDIPETAMATLISKSMDEAYANSVLCMSYDLGLSSSDADDGTITIRKKDFDALVENSEPTFIRISAIIELPLEFNVTSSISKDLTSLIHSTSEEDSEEDDSWDLLGRSSESNLDNIENYIQAVDSLNLDYAISKLPVKSSSSLGIKIDLDGDGTAFEESTLSISNGSLAVDPEKILTTNPLQPTLSLVIPEGSFSLLRDLTVGMRINLGLKVKEDYEIDFSSLIPSAQPSEEE